MRCILAHAEIHLFGINRKGQITMSEGELGYKAGNLDSNNRAELIGKNMYEVAAEAGSEALSSFIGLVEAILDGKTNMGTTENQLGERTYRTRFVANTTAHCSDGSQAIEVLGISIDVTDEARRIKLEAENVRLQAEEQVAKESNRLKSKFLANVSRKSRGTC